VQITHDASSSLDPGARRPDAPPIPSTGTYRMRIALTIAGSDSGGGAGIQADLKTFHQFGVFGTTVITAVTAQNTVGVQDWAALPVPLVTRQVEAVVTDLPPHGVKSGMLGSTELVHAVADTLARFRLPNYVLDPVMVATSGDRLLAEEAEQLIARRLVPLATLVTPNLDEARILVGEDITSAEQMERAARALLKMGARGALVKGGHLGGEVVVDVLAEGDRVQRFTRPKLPTTSTHGTGCTLSAAVAAGLALGRPLGRAVADALEFVHRAIATAPGLGTGHGPLNHFTPAPPAT
jgi:hydroxymethylpyrimidine/phosphomethylpyrimidine kinase